MFIDGIKSQKRPSQPDDDASKTNTIEPTQFYEPTFRPPETVATEDDLVSMHDDGLPAVSQQASDSIAPVKPTDKPAKKHFWQNIHLSKKQIIILSVVGVLLLGAGGFGIYRLLHKNKPALAPVAQKAEPKPVEPPKPTTLPSPLTGVQVQPDLTKIPVTGVMIENSPDARPQAGLRDAGVIYEAIAEGGITRFLALFQETQPDYIGPVRSVRPYYLEWLQGYDAAIAHVGGSPEALQLIKSAKIKDLDQFYNSGPYHRISTRYAPHNMYSSLPALVNHGKTKGYTSSTFTGFTRKADKAITPVAAASIDFTLSGYLYNAHYDYDAATNSYKRSQAGKPHTDDRSGAQLQPKVVVALIIPYAIKADGLHSDYSTTGSGKAFVFQDGGVTPVTWSKASSKAPLELKDATGATVALNAGQTWISVMGTEGSVAYR